MNLRCRISANAWEKKPLFSQVVYKAIKVLKALPRRTKKTKAGISLKFNAYYFSSLSAFIQVTIYRRVSNKFLFLWVPFQIFLLLLFESISLIYVRNFQTGPLDAWLSYLNNLISYVIVKDTCLPWLDKLTLVNGLKSYGVSTDIKQSSKQIASRWG